MTPPVALDAGAEFVVDGGVTRKMIYPDVDEEEFTAERAEHAEK